MILYFKRYFINSIYGKSAKVSRKNKKATGLTKEEIEKLEI